MKTDHLTAIDPAAIVAISPIKIRGNVYKRNLFDMFFNIGLNKKEKIKIYFFIELVNGKKVFCEEYIDILHHKGKNFLWMSDSQPFSVADYFIGVFQNPKEYEKECAVFEKIKKVRDDIIESKIDKIFL